MDHLQKPMAMNSLTVKGVASAAFGVLLFAALVWFGGFDEIDLASISPGYALACVVVYVVMLALRALNLRLICNATEGFSNFKNWCRLAAYHQLVFIVAPSGSGDIAFPALAKKLVGVDLSNAVGTIVLSRLRDIFAILGLGAVGLASIRVQPELAAILAILAFASLIWTELAIRSILSFLSLILPEGAGAQGWFKNLREASQFRSTNRMLRSVLTLSIWLCAGVGVWLGFSAAGHQLSLFECWIMVFFLNLAGALAVSVAGIGFVEAGAVGALMMFGETGRDAAAVAVVARPTMLLALIIAAFFLERAHQFPRFSRPPKP